MTQAKVRLKSCLEYTEQSTSECSVKVITVVVFPVLGFMALNGSVSPRKLNFPESGDRIVVNVGFIKGALSGFYYYQMNVIAIEETASKLYFQESTCPCLYAC